MENLNLNNDLNENKTEIKKEDNVIEEKTEIKTELAPIELDNEKLKSESVMDHIENNLISADSKSKFYDDLRLMNES